MTETTTTERPSSYPYLPVLFVVIGLTVIEPFPAIFSIIVLRSGAGTSTIALAMTLWLVPTVLLGIAGGAFIASRTKKRQTVSALHAGFLSALILSLVAIIWLPKMTLVLLTAKIPIACVLSALGYMIYKRAFAKNNLKRDVAAFS